MKYLLIIGARGWGREVYNMLPHCMGYEKDFTVKGFLDDKVDVLDDKPGYPPIIDSVENYILQPDDVFICALGDVQWKKYYVGLIQEKGGRFINIIHKTALLERNTVLGEGCIITQHVEISCDISIGNFVTIQGYSIIGHDAKIGDYVHLGTRTFMGGYSQVGNESILQTGAIVLPHVKVGNNSVVGAGSVVIRKVPNNTTVYGNPAIKLNY